MRGSPSVRISCVVNYPVVCIDRDSIVDQCFFCSPHCSVGYRRNIDLQ
jgi:hypothetical protein